MIDECQHCGSTDVETEPLRGDVVCTSCGTILEDNNKVVHEVQFEERPTGSSAIGSFFSSESLSKKPIVSIGGYYNRPSREKTMDRAKKKIKEVAELIKLGSQDKIDTCNRFYHLALQKNFTRGRSREWVIGACIYLTCRTSGTSHVMLLDISDALRIDIYDLGKTYLKLKQILHVNISLIDPCWLIWRFAGKLSFGDKCHIVGETALRLVKRMKKDNLHIGRRPSGLCGAALIIAARLHNFNRTIYDIIKVVQVHQSTVRKRLKEFGETASSRLTREEFLENEEKLETFEEHDPPSFKQARIKEKQLLERKKEQEMLINQKQEELRSKESNIDSEIEDIKVEIDRYLKDRKSNMIENYHGSLDEASQMKEFIARDTLDTLDYFIEEEENEDNLKMDLNLRPSLELLGTDKIVPEPENDQVAESVPQELSLEGIDDDEIDSYILSSHETNLKRKIWVRANKEYLEEQKNKREREKELERLREQGEEPPRKRKMFKRRAPIGPSNTTEEAISKIVDRKNISQRIDEITDSISKNSATIENIIPTESKHPEIDKIMRQITGKENPFERDLEEIDVEEDSEDEYDEEIEEESSIPNIQANNLDKNEDEDQMEAFEDNYDYDEY